MGGTDSLGEMGEIVSLKQAGKAMVDFSNQLRTLINEAGNQLNQRGTGFDFAVGVGGGKDSPTADDEKFPVVMTVG